MTNLNKIIKCLLKKGEIKMNFIMKKQLEMKKGSKKGFTLVEVIVVIVIIAILAAIAVPALTGYIDKAKQRQAIAEARNIVTAVQTIFDDAYAGTTTFNTTDELTGASEVPAGKSIGSQVYDLVGINYTPANIKGIKTTTKGAITQLIWENGFTVTYKDGKFTVTP